MDKRKLFLGLVCGTLLLALILLLLIPEDKQGNSFVISSIKDYDRLPITDTRDVENYETGSGEEGNEEVIELTQEDLKQSDIVQEFTTRKPSNVHATTADKQLITLSDKDAWSLLTAGRFNCYPTEKYYQVKQKVVENRIDKTTRITTKVWFWEDPSDDTNFNKVTVYKEWEVNEELADLFTHVFEDLYNDPSQPVININDRGAGTWVTRGKNHSDFNTTSAHAFGAAIDINPSTGTFAIDGIRYGNAYKNKAMPQAIWQSLPECHNKYHVIYQDSPMVKIFKSYGFVWGGDWSSGTDPMHFSFIGDGSNAREVGQSNFYEYNDVEQK